MPPMRMHQMPLYFGHVRSFFLSDAVSGDYRTGLNHTFDAFEREPYLKMVVTLLTPLKRGPENDDIHRTKKDL